MAIYQIKYTNGGSAITISPGQLNGPSGTSGVTDLDLYGQGTLNWGRGVDQNQLRILENFACPEEAGSNPPRPVSKLSAASATYNPDGVSTGINKPVRGQEWYNTTDNKLYVCVDPTGTPVWQTAGADPDLFLPLTGGTMSGNVDIVNSAPSIRMSISGAGVSSTSLEMYDTAGIKGQIALIQDPSTFEPGVVDLNGNAFSSDTDHLVWSKENVTSSSWIARLRMQDDGLVYEKGTGSTLGNGTIRISETITAAHPGNTLVTKDYIAGSGFVAKTGSQTMEGPLEISNAVGGQLIVSSPDGTANHNPTVMFNETGVTRAELTLVQGPTGFNSNIDHVMLIKHNGTKTNRITIEDERVVITNNDNDLGDIAAGAFVVDTYSANQGKAYTPSTELSDSGYTLVTKDFLYGAGNGPGFVSLEGQTSGLINRYRFGVDNDDISIDAAEFKSVLGTSAYYTSIEGPTFVSFNGTSNNTTTIVGGLIESMKTATNYSSLDGEQLQQTNGVNTSQLDASGLTFTTTDNASKKTVILDGKITAEHTSSDFTVIDGSWLQSTSATGVYGRIDGSTLRMQSTTDNFTQVVGSLLTRTSPLGTQVDTVVLNQRSAESDLTTHRTLTGAQPLTVDNIYHTTSTSGSYQFGYYSGGTASSNMRSAIRITEDNIGLRRLSSGNPIQALYVFDDRTQLQSPDTSQLGPKLAFHLNNAGATSGGGWGIDFTETTANTYRGGLYFQPTATEDEIRLEYRNDSQGITRMQMSTDRFVVNKPIHMSYVNADEQVNVGQAFSMRIWKQSTKPTAAQSMTGDIWQDTDDANDKLYMRVGGRWYNFIKDTFDFLTV